MLIEINENNWEEISNLFDNDGGLTDIIIEVDNYIRWLDVFDFIEKGINKEFKIENINIYDPKRNCNYDFIPENLYELFFVEGFYSITRISLNGLIICFHSFGTKSEKEIELDFDARQVPNYNFFQYLVSFINTISCIVDSRNWFMAYEMNRKEKIIIKDEKTFCAVSFA